MALKSMASKNCAFILFCLFLLTFGVTTLIMFYYQYYVASIMAINQQIQQSIALKASAHSNNPSDLAIPALIILGAQKAGTSTMEIVLNQIPEMWACKRPAEFHYFDNKCYQNTKRFPTYTDAISSYHQDGCSSDEYQQLLMDNFNRNPRHSDNYTSDKYRNSVYLSEKTPGYIYYPHAANIIVNYHVTTGTKLLVLLRDPAKRFISGLFMNQHNCRNRPKLECVPANYLQRQVYGYSDYDPNRTVSQIINYDNGTKIQTLNRNLGSLTEHYEAQMIQKHSFYESIAKLWQDYIYPDIGTGSGWKRDYYRIWTRGCYGPQLLSYWIELNKTGISNHFKVIQYERLHGNDKQFQNIMNLLRCYIHSNDEEAVQFDDYNEWMRVCMNEQTSVSKMKFKEIPDGSPGTDKERLLKSKYKSDSEQLKLLRASYYACNKVTKLILDDNYHDLIMEELDWSLWDI